MLAGVRARIASAASDPRGRSDRLRHIYLFPLVEHDLSLFALSRPSCACVFYLLAPIAPVSCPFTSFEDDVYRFAPARHHVFPSAGAASTSFLYRIYKNQEIVAQTPGLKFVQHPLQCSCAVSELERDRERRFLLVFNYSGAQDARQISPLGFASFAPRNHILRAAASGT